MAVKKRGRAVPGSTRTKGRSCDAKGIRYTSSDSAERAVWKRVRTQGADPNAIRAYRCKFTRQFEAPHWHVGHVPGNQMKR